MAEATFLNIPGNIKQKNLPFVLDPKNTINSESIDYVDKDTSEKLNESAVVIKDSSKAQIFSFRPAAFVNDEGASAEKSGFLRIAPGSFYNENGRGKEVTYNKPNNDLSYKLLYENYFMPGATNKSPSVSALNILNSVPSVTIREYLQDSKLNQVANLFLSIVGGWNEGKKQAEEGKQDANGKTFFKHVIDFSKALFSNLGGLMKDAIAKVEAIKPDNFDGGAVEDEKMYVMVIPYALYYRMISSTTTNIYELPYSGKVIYQSDGVQGWNKDTGFGGLNTKGDSFIGRILNYVASNIKVNTSPTWTPKNDSLPVRTEMTFDLYNDTVDGAIKNFIFINTIVPGNKFMQYHVYQHAPNLYDVRINGINRLFMCAATIKVDQVGVLRSPSKEFLIRLKQNHINNKFVPKTQNGTLFDYIKIPDIYRVTISFESLLPDSYNNYIYLYYINSKIPTQLEGSDALAGNSLRTASVFELFADAITNTVGKLWESTK